MPKEILNGINKAGVGEKIENDIDILVREHLPYLNLQESLDQ